MSTVLDGMVFLLLVSAAASMLVFARPAPLAPTHAAADTADVVATTTATVEYEIGGVAPRGGPNATERTAHGTLAELLAAAAVADPAVEGTAAGSGPSSFETAVANATRNATRRRGGYAQVRAVWAPYPGAPLSGTVTAGPTPPQSADVHAATLVVPSGVGDAGVVTDSPTPEFDALADRLARAVVRTLFEPRSSRLALSGPATVSGSTVQRYDRLSESLGVPVSDALARRNATAANQRLEAALATRFERDLTERYESPANATQAVRVRTVRITVRKWSA
ncbi:hypothetical protein VB779_12155 [Haloarculaceae archaeon H-GB11]|nr:hypothetical protein [Haloarculaceae archaeon H-GB11]